MGKGNEQRQGEVNRKSTDQNEKSERERGRNTHRYKGMVKK